MPQTRICEICLTKFQCPPSSKKRFCERACYLKWVDQGSTRRGSELECVICGKGFYVMPSRTDTAIYCSYRCHQVGEGRKGGRVRGEQKKQASQGKAYTKTNGRHTHRVVAEEKLGRPLTDQEVVHHLDGDILNNHHDNLEVLPSQSEHMEKHRSELLAARKEKHGY